MTKSTQNEKCSHCGFPLPPNHQGVCPKCGKEGKQINIIVHDTVHVLESTNVQLIREFLERRLWAILLLIPLTFLNSFIGLFVVGWPSVPINLVINAFTFWVGLKAFMKVREISR